MESISTSSLKQGYPGITSALGETFAEAAAVCLEDQNHIPEAPLVIKGHANTTYNLSWEPTNDQQKRAWADLQDATEQGAYGIAALLIAQCTDLHVVERSEKGTGFDFWLAKKVAGEDDNPNFLQNRERMEVSGILSGTDAQINARIKEKVAQTSQSDGMGIPAWVAVIEFSLPQSTLDKK